MCVPRAVFPSVVAFPVPCFSCARKAIELGHIPEAPPSLSGGSRWSLGSISLLQTSTGPASVSCISNDADGDGESDFKPLVRQEYLKYLFSSGLWLQRNATLVCGWVVWLHSFVSLGGFFASFFFFLLGWKKNCFCPLREKIVRGRGISFSFLLEHYHLFLGNMGWLSAHVKCRGGRIGEAVASQRRGRPWHVQALKNSRIAMHASCSPPVSDPWASLLFSRRQPYKL